MSLEDLVARYATSAFGLALLVAMAAARASTSDGAFKRDLRGAQGYLLLFLSTATLRALLPNRWVRIDQALFVSGLVLFAWSVIRGFAAIWSTLHKKRTGSAPPKILRDLVDGVLFVIALLIILQSTLSINLSAVLASSAVLSLVLGLALQDTLGNLFAGLSLEAERPFTEGDWVRIGPHQGQVIEIGWRVTRLLTGAGEALTIPNNAVAKESVYNFSRRGPSLRKVTLPSPLDVPPNTIKEVALSVLSGIAEISTTPPPAVRTTEFTGSSVSYEITFWVPRWELGGPAEDEVRSQLWYRLQRAGLTLTPRPTEVRLSRAPSPASTDTAEIRALLDQVDLLAPVDPVHRAALASRARLVRFGRGEWIVRQGELTASSLFLVVNGEVAIRVRTADSVDHEVARLGRGEIFGEVGALTGDPRSATVAATRDSTLAELDRQAFDEIFREVPGMAQALADLLQKRREAFFRAIERVAPEMTRPHEERLMVTRLKSIFKNLT